MHVSKKVALAALVVAAATAVPSVAGANGVGLFDRDSYDGGDLYAVGLAESGRKLVDFDPVQPETIRSNVAITGLSGDRLLVGIDYRVQNGKLYGVGNQGGIYTVADSGQARKVGQLSVALSGANFGVDFNPAANALRVVSTSGQNLRQPFGTGDAPNGATVADGTLTYILPTGNVRPSGICSAAYTNNDLSTTTATTLFDIDATLDQVAIQSPANAGSLAATGKLARDAGRDCGFDIYSVVEDGVTQANFGLATLGTNGTYRLTSINLLTGESTSEGAFPYPVTDIAVPLNQ